jgi:signal peptidase II
MSFESTSLRPRTVGKAAFFFGVVATSLALDLATKQFVSHALPPGEQIPVVGDYFSLLLIQNPGVAFGIELGPYGQWIMIALSFMALGLLGMMYRATPATDRTRLMAMALIWGGAIGNMIDRVRSARGVVDFLVFQYGDWQSPVFNVADVAVTSGAILLALALWQEEPRAIPAPVPERRRGPTSPTTG